MRAKSRGAPLPHQAVLDEVGQGRVALPLGYPVARLDVSPVGMRVELRAQEIAARVGVLPREFPQLFVRRHVLPQGGARPERVAVRLVLVDEGDGGLRRAEARGAEMHERLDELRAGATETEDQVHHGRHSLAVIAGR